MNSGTGNKVADDDFLKVLLTLKDSTMRATHVAEVAKVVSINEDLYCCKTLSTGQTINAYALAQLKLDDETHTPLQVNDIVVILFTDTDFRKNLRRVKDGKEEKYEEQKLLHTVDYGIIIGIL